MAIITFMSDFGTKDHYVASVKAKILSMNEKQTIIDISHNINPHDIMHASFVLNAVFRDFPKGTVHLVAVDSQIKQHEKFIAIKLEDHYFLGTDNGLFSLISEVSPTLIVEIEHDTPKKETFAAKNILANIAFQIANGEDLQTLGKVIPSFNKMTKRQLRTNKNTIAGHIVHVDAFGNLITNISKNVVEQIREARQIEILFGRENVTTIHSNYHSVEEGNCAVFFNSSDLLEITINTGNANQLLGLNFDSPVNIIFTPTL